MRLPWSHGLYLCTYIKLWGMGVICSNITQQNTEVLNGELIDKATLLLKAE